MISSIWKRLIRLLLTPQSDFLLIMLLLLEQQMWKTAGCCTCTIAAAEAQETVQCVPSYLLKRFKNQEQGKKDKLS